MSHKLTRLEIRRLVQCLESFENVSTAKLLVCDINRSMTVDARAGLLRYLLSLGECLIVKHVCMATLFTEVFRKRVAGPHHFQPWVFFETRLRHDGTRIGLRRCAWLCLAA